VTPIEISVSIVAAPCPPTKRGQHRLLRARTAYCQAPAAT